MYRSGRAAMFEMRLCYAANVASRFGGVTLSARRLRSRRGGIYFEKKMMGSAAVYFARPSVHVYASRRVIR